MHKVISWFAQHFSAYGRKTLPQIIAAELEAKQREAMQCQHVIESHKFQLHMANANINALRSWAESNRMKKKESQNGNH